MFDMDVGDRSRVLRRRMGLGLAGVAVLGLGIWGFVTQAVGAHVTDCHFDSQGAYAKVRVNNVLGSSARRQNVYVNFYVKGSRSDPESPYEASFVTVNVPAHGRGTGVVHEIFPPHGNLADPAFPDYKVKGRTVYFVGDEFPRVVTKQFAMAHPKRTHIETVPDDPHSLRCEITDEEGD